MPHSGTPDCSAHLINVAIDPVVQDEHHQQLLHISLGDVQLLGHKGDPYACVGLYELQHHLHITAFHQLLHIDALSV